ncbi:hypothetical protein BCR42DRAFT_495706 [Absidia repens]|uniref:GST N-terminal domain-containing protein n=1 Tax=Absidia repens TaxID=90262 RepID=A0A1X2I291_9FUNG|nr:hypothetical protein BCR42DRAFT_495706 [Absidia repens]
MTVDVYTFPPSLWAAVPRLIIEEKNIPDINYITTDLSKAENFSPEFLKLNPNHTIPVVVDEQANKTLTDSIAVSKYLDEKSGNTLTPKDKHQVDQMNGLLDLLHGTHDVGNPLFFTAASDQDSDAKRAMVVPFLKNRIAGWQHYLAATQDEATKQMYQQQIQATEQLIAAYDKSNTQQAATMYNQHDACWQLALDLLDMLEATLKTNDNGSAYLVGNEYTLADVHTTPVLARFILIKGEDAILGGRPLLKSYYDRVRAKPNFKTI